MNHGWYEGMADKIPSTDNGLEAANNIIKEIHTLRQRHIVSQYLTNAFDMMRNWSLDRRKIKQFYEKPYFDDQTWSLAWSFLYKSKTVTRTTLINSEEVFILTKDEHKNLINLKLIQGKLTQLSLNFDSFVGSILKVKLISANGRIAN